MKLLETAIKFGKAFTKLTSIGQLAVIGVLAYGAFAFGNCTKKPDIDKVEVNVEKTTEYVAGLEKQIDSLEKNVAQKETTITKLKFEISVRQKERNNARQQLLTLEDRAKQERELVSPGTLPLTDSLISGYKTQLAQADTVIQIQEDVIFTREEQIKMLNDALYMSQQRGDTLQTTLDQTLKAYQRKGKMFGVIPLPSRKTVAVIAFVGGAYLGAQAVR